MGQNIIVDGMEYIAVNNGKESMIVFSTSKLPGIKGCCMDRQSLSNGIQPCLAESRIPVRLFLQ